ncbi:DUF7079 family protein [Candidatus Uabimicrobium amorphum]|uniref:DUF7079 domain-containing protein n=1 Tax=Uabimicrobium amorphum TaxID=2596890 RepID=A0A5S9F1P8_UABAM|nr:STM3941 family protein [Candidatus Uabimicrobium amorphum]BBM82293.1 hypothetical protein UABAM_00636 [Candidatus Uabimicrobium amorphum]
MDIKINKDYRYITTLLWYISFFALASAISYLLPFDLQKNYARFSASHRECWFISVGTLLFTFTVFIYYRSLWKTILISFFSSFLFALIGYEFFGNLIDDWLDVLIYIGTFLVAVFATFSAFFYFLVIIDHLMKFAHPAFVLNDNGLYDYSHHMGFISWENIQKIHILDLGSQKQIAVEIKNLSCLSLRPFSFKKLCLQAIFLLTKHHFVHHIHLNNRQVSPLTFSHIKVMLQSQGKLAQQHPGQGFIREFALSNEERNFANSFAMEERLPVWKAIADLFLDTEIELLYEPIAQVLANSPYDLRTLNHIYTYEVAPVYHVNLLSVAGEWGGFSEESVKVNITKSLYKKRRSYFSKAISFLLQYIYTFTTKKDWKIIIEKVKLRRQQQS